ncbi:MAG: hypothetical protein CVU12_00525 [Bacteroidetes bacterium HGW-Bacteroidetes-7]|nr:MAG: hypothetical protein CVU12_00525 [Bacteroidetes bacterium HGW-Bacteroidetes-7]
MIRIKRELKNVRGIIKICFTALLTAVLCGVLLFSSTGATSDNSRSAKLESKPALEPVTVIENESETEYAFTFSMPEASPFMAIVHDGTVSLPGVTARSSSPWSSSGVNIRLGKTLQYSEIRENSLKRVFAHSIITRKERQILTFSYSNNKFVYLLREIII